MELIADELRESGLVTAVDTAETGAEGLSRLAEDPPDLVLIDYRLPDIDGLELMRRMRTNGFDTPVIFVTTAESVNLAVQAMKLGAEDFVQKQEGYLDVLPLLVREALERQRLRRERDALESQLRQSEKLASLGILASGLAHNINNRLTSLKTFFELAPHRLDDTDFLDQFLQTCREDLDKITVLVQELTKYAFSDNRPKQPFPLSELVVRALNYLDDHIARKNIRIQTRFGTTPRIPVDPEGIKQLVVNLVKNSIQASPVGGEVEISLGADPADGSCVVLRVTDDGPGLTDDIRQKIFDPFFTTKDHGLGIGLFICHKIVGLHGGRIEVENGRSRGTTFVVRLPASSNGFAADPAEAS